MASIQQHTLQSRAHQMFDAWLAKSTAVEGRETATVDKREAEQLTAQAQKLSKSDVDALRATLLAQLQADAFQVSPGAREVFAQFFKIPPESIPVSSTARSNVQNAQATRVANEADRSVRVPTKELREMMRNMEGMPDNLRAQLAHSVLNAMQQGNVKLDPEGRKLLTKFVATNQGPALSVDDAKQTAGTFKQAGEVLAKAAKEAVVTRGKEFVADLVNVVEGNGGLGALDRALSMGVQPMSYAQYVAAHGGSFEDILFAFLMQLADKTDKKLMEKIKEMDKRERLQKAGGSVQSALNNVLSDTSVDPETGRGGPAAPAAGGGRVQRVSTQLEAVVQSAHHATGAQSKGGVQITKEEADRLVEKLGRLPPHVQTLLAGSVASAMKAKGLPLQKEAFDALSAWGNSVTGGKFNVGAFDPNVNTSQGAQPDTALAQALSNSDKLEDKIASFLVDTLVDPGKGLKEKFEPFKAMRAELDALAPAAAQAPAAEAKGAKATQNIVEQAEVAEPAMAPENEQSDTMAQHELQRLMEDRKRVFQMLSDMMKAMSDMIMVSVRNMRG